MSEEGLRLMTQLLPASSDELTPEILNPLLAGAPAFSGAKIVDTSVEAIGVGQGTMSEIARVSLTFADPASSAPGSIVAKLHARDQATREANFSGLGQYETEYLFYRLLATDCGLPVPVCYYAGLDPDAEKYLLLIEDLSGYHNPTPTEEITFEEASKALELTASMHATWWGGERLAEYKWLDSFRTPEMRFAWDALFHSGLEKIPGIEPGLWPDGVIDILYRLDDKNVDRVFEKYMEPPVTLCQSDFRSFNILISRSGHHDHKFKFIDFGTVRLGKAAADIPYFMAQSFSPGVRREYEPELMRRYHGALLDGGVEDYDWDQFIDDYRWANFIYPYAIVAAIGRMDATPLGDEWFADRIPRMSALIDWNCGELLE